MRFIIFTFIIAAAFAADPSSSTKPPTPSSTESPTSTQPTPPSPSPTPIPSKKPDTLDFNITTPDGKVCALFSFVATINVKEEINGTETEKLEIPLFKTTVMTSDSCDNETVKLVLNINGEKDEILTLHLNHSKSQYGLNYVEIALPKYPVFSNNETYFEVDDSKSYLCLSNPAISLLPQDVKSTDQKQQKAYLTLKDLKVDAFRSETAGSEFRQAAQCETDFPTNDFVPLAVGCALISLVFIVLIAYIVGRKRSRRMTYQTV